MYGASNTVMHLFCIGDMEVLLLIEVSISVWYFVPTKKSYRKDECEEKTN